MAIIERNRRFNLVRAVTSAVLVMNAVVGLGGCGSSGAPRTQGGPAACAPHETSTGSASVVLTSAMLLSAIVQVSGPPAGTPKCVALSPRSTVTLRIGDRAEFEANDVPEISPAGTGVVSISSRPGPTSSGPGAAGGLHTTHVIVQLTAMAPGRVTVRWVDCSGTGC